MTAEDRQRYTNAMHAVQSGVAAEMNIDANEVSPKHLRVGVSAAMITDFAIMNLLMQKGLFTQDEYEEALANAAENEVKLYQNRLSKHYGATIDLL